MEWNTNVPPLQFQVRAVCVDLDNHGACLVKSSEESPPAGVSAAPMKSNVSPLPPSSTSSPVSVDTPVVVIESNKQNCSLLRMSSDILVYMLYFLDDQSCRCCFSSCQRMQPVSRIEGLWKSACERLRRKVKLLFPNFKFSLTALRCVVLFMRRLDGCLHFIWFHHFVDIISAIATISMNTRIFTRHKRLN